MMKNLHIGIILDGNRRWAREHNLKPWRGHYKGFDRLKELLGWLIELEIKETSLYCFSIQNFNRSEEEKEHLFDIFRKAFDFLIKDKRIDEHKIRIRFAGRTHLFPEDLQKKMEGVMEKTKGYDKFVVNFALAYGGREEIVDTVNKMVKENKEITEESLQENLWVPENIDIIIRTSGENRTSNFFIWQAGYAELFFLKKYWPDFEKEDLVNVLKEYKEKRERRFGK